MAPTCPLYIKSGVALVVCERHENGVRRVIFAEPAECKEYCRMYCCGDYKACKHYLKEALYWDAMPQLEFEEKSRILYQTEMEREIE